MNLKSRRKLLQTGVAAALFAASGVPVAAQQRGHGGRLRVGVADGGPRDAWGHTAGGSAFMALAGQGAVFDTLTEASEDGSLRGELALDWVPSEDASVWRLFLRDGVRFHDGSTFTSSDVVRSFAHHQEQPFSAPILQTIHSAIAVSSNEVRFVLEAGNPDFPWFLSDPSLIIHSERHLAGGGPQGVGTGLFRVDSFAPGQRLLARRVSTHFKDSRAGWFDEVELLALPDETHRLQALVSGRVDVVNGLMGQTLARLKSDDRFAVQTVPDAEYIALECTGPDGLEMRATLAALLNRPRLVGDALGELGRVGHDVPIPGASQAYSEATAKPVPQELPIVLERSVGLAGARIVTALAGQMREHGIVFRLALPDEPAAVIVRRLPVRPLADWAWSDWAAISDTSRLLVQDHLLAARAELDPTARAGIYSDIAALVRDCSSLLIPCFVANTLAYRRNLRLSGSTRHLLDLDGARIAERWWRA
ncbi:ABC transporter substrate-binding protein [Tropicimonas sp. S265A]|uniref:ABC transporter substrate-binding protein n=1 Tax=Tropicimonas sp. S265A TaxID=3415134 RepID=UPI003C7A520E